MSKSTISTFEVFQMFPDAQSARTYFEQKRWPDGATCPACHEAKRIHARMDGFYRCNACVNDFTVRTGTIFERSKVPLHKWLYAMYPLVTARKGISSLQLAKQIGVTQKTAWFMLQRLRAACGNDPTKLAGIIECDETYIAALDAITHAVLSYRPADKGQAAATIERRVKGRKAQEKKGSQDDWESSI
jgi:transposase-like protein